MRFRWAGLLLALSACSNSGFDYEEVVRLEMRDPDSAQFSEVATAPGVACGFVNAKNAYGGYAGKMIFVATAPSGDLPSVRLIETWTKDDGKFIRSQCPADSGFSLELWALNKRGDELKEWAEQNQKAMGLDSK